MTTLFLVHFVSIHMWSLKHSLIKYCKYKCFLLVFSCKYPSSHFFPLMNSFLTAGRVNGVRESRESCRCEDIPAFSQIGFKMPAATFIAKSVFAELPGRLYAWTYTSAPSHKLLLFFPHHALCTFFLLDLLLNVFSISRMAFFTLSQSHLCQ